MKFKFPIKARLVVGNLLLMLQLMANGLKSVTSRLTLPFQISIAKFKCYSYKGAFRNQVSRVKHSIRSVEI